MFWFFGCEACGILAPKPGTEPASPALKGDVLTTGPPGKSLDLHFLKYKTGGKFHPLILSDKRYNFVLKITPLYIFFILFFYTAGSY